MANKTGIGGFRPGQSGNPGGRRKRVITDLLEKSSQVKVTCGDVELPRGQALAEIVWQALMSGTIVLPGAKKKRVLSPSQWLEMVRWLYSQIDGPPKAELDVTTEGQPINDQYTVEERLTLLLALLDKARVRQARQAENNKGEKP